MKRFISFIAIALIASSCQKNLEELNLDIKRPSAGLVPSGTVFTTAETNLFEQMVTTNVNRNVFRLFAQQWTETTYTDESNYDITTRKIPDQVWLRMYVSVLNNLKEAKALVTSETPIGASETAAKANKLLVIELLNIYSYQVLVDTFGDIPYTQALDPNTVNPKYDDAKTVYADLVKRINAANSAINTLEGSFGEADLMYGGNMTKWKKFANGLKLKIGLTLVDFDASTSKTMIEDASKGVFTSNADNAKLVYSSSVPNTNPVWLDLVQSGRHDYVPANTVVDITNTLNDPRRATFFTLLGGKYIGGKYAAGGNFTNFSQIGNIFSSPTTEGVIMDYAEVAFGLSEAAARGYNVGGTAEDFYNKAVTASIKYWGGSDADVATYLKDINVAYTSAKGTYKQKIGTQKYLALYNRGFEAWTEWRRLDAPTFNVPANKTYAEIPVRFTFPVGEQTLNFTNWTAASTAVGGDKLTTKLFWDKF
jgi:Starch-binding associating with outer membrane